MERLTAREGRVLSSLVEKHLTVPQYYPLTLGALLAACNQLSNRDPVTTFTEGEVLEAVEALRAKRLVRAVLPSHGRSAVRYRHVLDETWGLDAPQLALLAVLELRGPQTVAELRARTERMAAVESVDHELDLLAGREDPLVLLVGRRPGQKEDRWASLLAQPGPGDDTPAPSGPGVDTPAPSGPGDDTPAPSGPAAADGARTRSGEVAPGASPGEGAASRRDVDELRRDLVTVQAELEVLRGALDVLRSGLEDLRTSLGG